MKYTCPCCGFMVNEEPNLYEICPICAWEDDPSQSSDPSMSGGANKLSLIDAQREFLKNFPILIDDSRNKYKRDTKWKPVL